jgi:hypothetical protein
MANDIKTAVRRLRRQGYDLRINGGGHWEISKDGVLLHVMPESSKNRRIPAILKTKLRKAERERLPAEPAA